MSDAATFHAALADHARRTPERLALIEPGGPTWTYRELAGAVTAMVATLRAGGVDPGARVALLARNSATACAAYLAITAANVAVPLNPAYRRDELEFYFDDLGVSAVVAHDVPEAEQLALRRRLPRFDTVDACPGPDSAVPEPADPDEVAIVLHTSGTTARPKIVPLTHANVMAACSQMRSTLALTPDDRCINVMPAFHIHGLSAVLASVLAGGSVLCPSEFSAPDFFPLVHEYEPTWFTAAPTIHQSVLEWAAKLPEQPPRHTLRFVRSASSGMPPALIAELEATLGVPQIEAYGMSETAPLIATNPLPPGVRKVGSVGRPAGCEVAIVRVGEADTTVRLEGARVPTGEVGEIVVRGPNVIRAYEGDERVNAEQFLALDGGGGWLRTGDLGHLDPDGYLFVTGRLKEIINRGGEKITPPEVDRVLRTHPAVSAAVTFPVPHPRLGEDVAAVVVVAPGAQVTERELQDHVAATLADFKVPRHIVFRDAIPQGSTGKPKRDSLAHELGLTDLYGAAATLPALEEFTLPRTPEEEILADIWTEVLQVDHVGVHDDFFFELAGDSVLAAKTLTRVNDALGVDLSFLDFLEHSTIAALATRAAEEHGNAIEPPPPVERAPDDARLPLSIGQHALLILQLLDPADGSNNVYRAIRMRGELDQSALHDSLTELVARHDSLRTTYTYSTDEGAEGEVRRTIAPFQRLKLPVSDLADVAADKREALAIALLEREARAPFDLAAGPMLRARLVRVAPDDHILLLTMHHIMMDGWSIGILFSELAVLYDAFSRGHRSPLTPPALRHADYAYWQRQRLQGPVLEQLTAFWKEQLAGAPAALPLPFDHRRPPVLERTGARINLAFGNDIARRIREVARAEGATLFMGLLACFDALLAHESSTDDIVVGSPISGRDRPELESLVGYFSNSLVLRTRLDGDPTFAQVVARVRSTVIGAHVHHELPFASVVAAVGDPRVMNRNPLFQVNFRLRNIPVTEPALAGLHVEEIDLHNRLAKFDLAFEVWETVDGLAGFTEFSTELFEPATVTGLLSRFERLLGIFAASPTLRLSEAFAQLEAPS